MKEHTIMDLVATFIADPAVANLTQGAVDAAQRALSDHKIPMGTPDWLHPAIACDLPLFDLDEATAYQILRPMMNERRLDLVVQPVANRRKKLLVTDMESTMIVNEMIDELANYLGVGAKVAAITERAMRGDIGFRPALLERASLLGGLEETVMLAARQRISFMPGGRTLIATLTHAGTYTALVSGGFRVFTDWVKERAGFDIAFANDLEVKDGVLTGQLEGPLIGQEGKAEALSDLCQRHGWQLDDALAVGDGANDLLMLKNAGMGVAYHAKPAVAAAARASIEHGDLTALLYMQGFRHSEFVIPD